MSKKKQPGRAERLFNKRRIEADAMAYRDMENRIYKAGIWHNGIAPEQVALYFNGCCILLNPDGTYILEDTTGG